jgi:hypothetical protein
MMRQGRRGFMDIEQVKILSERVVCEIFSQIFAAENDETDEGVAFIRLTKKLSSEELSRRIDSAVAMSAEKLEKIRAGC